MDKKKQTYTSVKQYFRFNIPTKVNFHNLNFGPTANDKTKGIPKLISPDKTF